MRLASEKTAGHVQPEIRERQSPDWPPAEHYSKEWRSHGYQSGTPEPATRPALPRHTLSLSPAPALHLPLVTAFYGLLIATFRECRKFRVLATSRRLTVTNRGSRTTNHRLLIRQYREGLLALLTRAAPPFDNGIQQHIGATQTAAPRSQLRGAGTPDTCATDGGAESTGPGAAGQPMARLIAS